MNPNFFYQNFLQLFEEIDILNKSPEELYDLLSIIFAPTGFWADNIPTFHDTYSPTDPLYSLKKFFMLQPKLYTMKIPICEAITKMDNDIYDNIIMRTRVKSDLTIPTLCYSLAKYLDKHGMCIDFLDNCTKDMQVFRKNKNRSSLGILNFTERNFHDTLPLYIDNQEQAEKLIKLFCGPISLSSILLRIVDCKGLLLVPYQDLEDEISCFYFEFQTIMRLRF